MTIMKIALLGYGRMGKAIERVAKESGHEIVLVVDGESKEAGTDDRLRRADVAIEFSVPTAAVKNYEWCFRNRIPVVSGTTGWLERWDEVEKTRMELGGCFFYASNFSIGVNLFFHLNRQLAAMMSRFKDYKVFVEETHHIHKLDAPSGTAVTLAQGIIEEHDGYSSWRLAENGEVGENVIPVTAKREGEVAGIHSVTYRSVVDEIEIRHSAYSREGFAKGAVLAAEFLKDKHEGVFGMDDLLRFRD